MFVSATVGVKMITLTLFKGGRIPRNMQPSSNENYIRSKIREIAASTSLKSDLFRNLYTDP